jgi:hypothetical protein
MSAGAVILRVGKMKEKAYRQMADEYLKRLSRYGTYTDSTFWFDIHYVVCILAVATAILLIVNFIWKKRMMRGEKELLASSGKAVSA